MNPEDLDYPVAGTDADAGADALFRFNPALDAARDVEDRRIRRARRDARRQREVEAANAAVFPPLQRKGQFFPFNPHTPLFSHYPARVAVLLNEALDHPVRVESIRRLLLFGSKGFKKDSTFDTLFSLEPVYAITQRQRLDEFLKTMADATSLRGRLRRFLHRWRVSRLQAVNTDDIVTCEIPRRPIRIVDWTRKQVYVYEAATLAQDIRTRLLNHDGFFDEPQDPRNPLTNLPLTLAQNIAVWSQFCLYPNSLATVVSGFRHSRYSLDRFEQEFNTVLKLHALRTTLLDPANADGNERIEEFIDHAYSSLCLVAPGATPFRYWRSYCLRYYEADFLHINNPLMIRRTKADILQEIVESGLVDRGREREQPVVAPPPLRRIGHEHFFHFRVAPDGEEGGAAAMLAGAAPGHILLVAGAGPVPGAVPGAGAALAPGAVPEPGAGAALAPAPAPAPAPGPVHVLNWNIIPNHNWIIDPVGAPPPAGAPPPPGAPPPAGDDDADTVVAEDTGESEDEDDASTGAPENPNANVPDPQAVLDAQFELELSLALALSLV